MTAPTTTPEQGLAYLIRTETSEAHHSVEDSQFVHDLMAGRLPVFDYTRLAAQHHAIYLSLEAAVAANTDPSLTPFLSPELDRVAALEADLEFLAGPGWQTTLDTLPSASAYATRIETAAADWPGGLLAHHYIRYLGDLSGGQMIRASLERTYGFEQGQGTAFYRFPGIASPRAFKVRYRQLLDGLPWNDEERRRLVDEVGVAFWHHGEIYRELQEASSK